MCTKRHKVQPHQEKTFTWWLQECYYQHETRT